MIPVIIQLADPLFVRQMAHATVHEPTATNPEQGLLCFNVNQDEVDPLLRLLAESGICAFRVLCPMASMQSIPCQYIIEISQPCHSTRFYRHGYGISESDPAKATRFECYDQALKLLAEFLNPAKLVLSEPVEIRILPAPDDGPWTIEEILAREG